MERIIPGENFTQTWIIPFPKYLIEKALITYKQKNQVIREETSETFQEVDQGHCSFDVTFTQEDSLKFAQMVPTYVQINVMSKNGIRMTSTVEKIPVGRQYYDNVMEG